MIIYSPMPLETVFEGIAEMKSDLREIRWNGVVMQVKMLEDSRAQVVRLISPNPQDYMNPVYAPGNIIQFLPNL